MPTSSQRQSVPATLDASVAAQANILRTNSPTLGVLIEPDQRRLVALQPVPKGAWLFRIEGRDTPVPTRYSVQVGWEQHLDQENARDANDRVARFYWRYMNHDCDPSTAIHDREVVALRDIIAGDGITFDYNTTEWELAEPFGCHCGSPRCVGTVHGARHLTAAQRARIEHLLPDYLRR